jgi:cell division initiation protein
MDNMEVSSAREIEASLRGRLDTESIAVVHEAAQQEERPPEDSDIGVTAEDEGEHTDPGFTISEQEIAESEEEVIVSTETGEVDQDATRLMETETVVSEEPVSEEELAAADVAPEHSEAQEEAPLSEEQPTEVLRSEDMGPLGEEPEEPPVEEVEPSTAGDETQQFEEPPVSEPAEEVEVNQEETSLAEERSSEEFFDREQADQGDSRVFRASRFLRRRE